MVHRNLSGVETELLQVRNEAGCELAGRRIVVELEISEQLLFIGYEGNNIRKASESAKDGVHRRHYWRGYLQHTQRQMGGNYRSNDGEEIVGIYGVYLEGGKGGQEQKWKDAKDHARVFRSDFEVLEAR